MRYVVLALLALGCGKQASSPGDDLPADFMATAQLHDLAFKLDEDNLTIDLTLLDKAGKPITTVPAGVGVEVALYQGHDDTLCTATATLGPKDLDAKGHAKLTTSASHVHGGPCNHALFAANFSGPAKWHIKVSSNGNVAEGGQKVDSLVPVGKRFDKSPELDGEIAKLASTVASLDATSALPTCEAKHFGDKLRPSEGLDQKDLDASHKTGGFLCTELCYELLKYRSGDLETDPATILADLRAAKRLVVYVQKSREAGSVDVTTQTFKQIVYDGRAEVLDLTSGKAVCALPLHVTNSESLGVQMKETYSSEDSAWHKLSQDFEENFAIQLDAAFKKAGLDTAAPRSPKPKL
jgi:hypothetical protein